MFSQSGEFSQSSNGDYNFLHNASQASSQFEFDGMLNKNQNILDGGELGIINEENPLSPMKINYNESKKSIINNQNLSKSSKYSFGITNNNPTKINITIGDASANPNVEIKHTQKNITSNTNKENINNNIIQNKNTDNNNNFLQFNFDTYKCQLSQQIDQVEKIASQSMNNVDSSPNFNKLNNNKEKNDLNVNNNYNPVVNNNISEEEILEHQRFNKYCSDLIDSAMNKNLEYIDNIKNNFVNSLDTYKVNFKTNAEVIKKLILLYSDDIFQKEQNKIIISNLTDQLLTHINSFFQEMSKFNNFNLNISNISNNNNTNENS
jgi:hypothetical protein